MMTLNSVLPLAFQNAAKASPPAQTSNDTWDSHAFGSIAATPPETTPYKMSKELQSIGDIQRIGVETQAQTAQDMLANGLVAYNSPANAATKYGYNSYVPASLIQSESSGRWDAENTVKDKDGTIRRFVGQLQIGQGRLTDAIRRGVVPSDTTLDDLKGSKDLQIAVGNWHFKDLKDRINKYGFSDYIGKNINGTTLTMNSLLAMAHLGGFNGMRNYLKSGGSKNPNDGLTSLAKYARDHAN